MGEHNKVPVEQVPEVADFHAAKERLEAFRKQNPEFFTYLEELIDDYNTKLEAADKAARAKQVSCGDFKLDKFQRRYKPEELYQAVGREKFLELGGKISTKTQYECDKKRIDASIASGQIDEALASLVRVISPVFSTPKKVEVP